MLPPNQFHWVHSVAADVAVQGKHKICLPLFFFLSWLHLLWFTYAFFNHAVNDGRPFLTTLFHLSAWPFYSLLYLLPTLAPTLLLRKFLPSGSVLVAVFAVFGTVLTLLLILTDSLIYDLYAFHINSFVLNLILTPGGIDSLGSGSESFLSMALLLLRTLVIQTACMGIAMYNRTGKRCRTPGYWRLSAAVAGLFFVQGSVYGISDIINYGPVLDSSKVYPLFQRVRFRKLAQQFGFTRQSREEWFADLEAAPLNYPRAEVAFSAVPQSPNIIVLVAESLRWDQLQPQTMPNTWAFSEKGLRFEQHYSSGNGTREGLFGLFYGLYGSYWESFMHAGQAPLLMQRLQTLDYQLDLRTSASFTYPEFDKTLFSSVPQSALHTADAKLPPWQRDERNTDELLAFLEKRNPAHPFMEFFFFESTHAAYSFPPTSALTPDYQDTVDYTRLSRAELANNITPLFNRYRNAAHWIDMQLGRIYQALEQNNLLDNTIVVITGDHGEEFMEQGAWGHNSSFVEEQIHVPLVVLLPDTQAAVVKRMTSHVDIATTLLHALGAPTETADWSQGKNLLDPVGHDHLVVSDWHSIGVMTHDLKYRIPYLVTSGTNYWEPTDQRDLPLAGTTGATLIQKHRDLLLQSMAACMLFTRTGNID